METEEIDAFDAFAKSLVDASSIGDFASKWRDRYPTVEWLWKEIGVGSDALFARLFQVAQDKGLPNAQAYFIGDKHMAVASLKTLVASTTGEETGVSRIFGIIGKGRVQPSTPLGATQLRQIQQQAGGNVPTILHARPTADAAPPIPLPLVHPAFGRFLDSMADLRDVTIADIRVFSEWCAASADVYSKQGEKHDAMMPVLQKLFGDIEDGDEDDDRLDVVSHGLEKLGIRPDFVLRKGQQLRGTILTLGETKLEGSVGDPLLQTILNYVQYWEMKQDTAVFEHTSCPSLLIELLGPCMRVSAVAFLHRPVVQRLTPLLHFLPVFDDDKNHQRQALGALLALRDTARDLNKFYSQVAELDNTPVAERGPVLSALRSAGVPLLKEARSGMSIEEFSLPYPLQDPALTVTLASDIARKFVYLVEMADGTTCVIKYTQQYGEPVHVAWAQQGHAPPLLRDIADLPGGWREIVMKHLSSEDGWVSLLSLRPVERRRARAAALEALRAAHAVRLPNGDGAHPLGVHGDARDPNVLVKRMEDGTYAVQFIDFDWAGEAGVSQYPAVINPEVEWADGVAPLGIMEQQHDHVMLRGALAMRTRPPGPIGPMSAAHMGRVPQRPRIPGGVRKAPRTGSLLPKFAL